MKRVALSLFVCLLGLSPANAEVCLGRYGIECYTLIAGGELTKMIGLTRSGERQRTSFGAVNSRPTAQTDWSFLVRAAANKLDEADRAQMQKFAGSLPSDLRKSACLSHAGFARTLSSERWFLEAGGVIKVTVSLWFMDPDGKTRLDYEEIASATIDSCEAT